MYKWLRESIVRCVQNDRADNSEDIFAVEKGQMWPGRRQMRPQGPNSLPQEAQNDPVARDTVLRTFSGEWE